MGAWQKLNISVEVPANDSILYEIHQKIKDNIDDGFEIVNSYSDPDDDDITTEFETEGLFGFGFVIDFTSDKYCKYLCELLGVNRVITKSLNLENVDWDTVNDYKKEE